jgi:hypothetical protein
MILAVIDSDKIAKTCPREFLRFRLELASNKVSMEEFSRFLDGEIFLTGVNKSVLEDAYKKLITKFKRLKKIKVKLTNEGALNVPSGTQYYMAKRIEYYDVNGQKIHREKFAGCIWVTEVKLPKYYKEIGIELIERRN